MKSSNETRFQRRRKQILNSIKAEIAIFPAALEYICKRDQHYPFRQDSDFLYLTGFEEPDSILVLLGSSKGPRSILYLKERNLEEERWVGERLGTKRAKRRFDIDEVRLISDFERDLPSLLVGFQTIHYPQGSNTKIDSILWRALQTSRGPRFNFPNILKDARLLTSEMRLIKDRDEVRSIRHACDITARAFLELPRQLSTLKSELHCARLLESFFAKYGGDTVSFSTIVASGKHATTLHHLPTFHPLWKRELVLIDAGAEFNGYAGDITRVFPPSGKFSEPQAIVYDLVLAAKSAAIEEAKPGSSLDDIHAVALKTLTKGLIELDIIPGPLSSALAQEAYKPYYMHRTSHYLGLDVHDIAPIYCDGHLIPPYARPLEPGMVFTIEPGLYFDPKDSSVPEQFRGIGIRLEDDILITPSGKEVLTSKMPSAKAEIEALFSK